MAILVRASFQMREFEDRFVTLGLNYRVIGGPRFYERHGDPRRAGLSSASSRKPPTTSPSSASSTCPSAGSANPPSARSTTPRAPARIPMLEAAAELAESDELKPKPRAALREVAANFERWQKAARNASRTPSSPRPSSRSSGYTEMWKNDRSAEAPGRLENLKELIRSMEEYESLRSFLEHVALVMDAEQNAELDAVNIMTLHSAKGLEFETVFLPGWEEGLFPHQRSLDEGGRAGLEEERRLAYVGLTRAKKHLHIWFVSNRRIHGLWQSTIPSRFLDELPEAHVEVAETASPMAATAPLWRRRSRRPRQRPYGASRFDKAGAAFSNTYATPGWQRAQQNRTEATDDNWGTRSGHQVERIGYGETDSGYGAGRTSVKGRTIDGELVAKSVADSPRPSASATASSTRNSATATSRRSRATSSPSTSTAPARRRCWTGSSAASEGRQEGVVRAPLRCAVSGGAEIWPPRRSALRPPLPAG